MARDATARLYDVDRRSVVLKKFTELAKYDIGSITFRAKEGRSIDLDKLHESIWATRLSGGTRSGLVSLDVTAAGQAVEREGGLVFEAAGSDAYFVLHRSREEKSKDVLDELRAALAAGEKVVRVTGRLDGWAGPWPRVLAKLPPKPRRILVTSFETAKERERPQEPESQDK